MEEKAAEPAIRFAEFAGAWEQRKIGDYLTLSKIPGHTGVDAKKLTVKLWGKGVVEKTDIYGGSQNTQYYVRRAGQFMYGKLDFLHAAFGIVPKSLDRFESTLDSPAFDLHEIDGAFLQNRVTQQNFYLKFGNIANGSRKAKRIHEVTFLDMPIVVPSYAEQKKIGAFLNKLDSLLTLHQRKYEKLLNIKKSMLEKMFPKEGEVVPEIRFKGFTGAWEERKLGDIADITGGGTPSTSNNDYWDGIINWYSPAEISNQIFLNSSQRKITELGYSSCSAKMLPRGTVLFTSRAGIGKTAILSAEGCTNQGFQSIVPHANELDSYFIFSRTHELKKYGEVVGAGSTFVEVSGKQMAAMTLMMPPKFNEQKIIGDFFKCLDSILTIHQRKLEMLKNIKRAFLDKMFV